MRAAPRSRVERGGKGEAAVQSGRRSVEPLVRVAGAIHGLDPQPAEPIGQAPAGQAIHRRLRQRDAQKARRMVGDLPVPRLGGQGIVALLHVELRYGQTDALARQSLEEIAVDRRIERPGTRVEVRLKPDPVERNARRPEGAHEVQQRLAPGGVERRVVFQPVFVDEQLGPGRQRAGVFQRALDVAAAIGRVEGRDPPAAEAVLRLDRLVDDIPLARDIAEAGHHPRHGVADDRPVRNGLVPQEGVAADALAVIPGEGGDPAGRTAGRGRRWPARRSRAPPIPAVRGGSARRPPGAARPVLRFALAADAVGRQPGRHDRVGIVEVAEVHEHAG